LKDNKFQLLEEVSSDLGKHVPYFRPLYGFPKKLMVEDDYCDTKIKVLKRKFHFIREMNDFIQYRSNLLEDIWLVP